jgi:hypothetical protein
MNLPGSPLTELNFENLNRSWITRELAQDACLRRVCSIDGGAIGAQMQEATLQWNRTGKPARVFTEFQYKTGKTKKSGWHCERRVVAKAEHIDGKENPRFVVTSLASGEWQTRTLYEELYCARGDMENRIKEQQLFLFACRTSCATMRANQVRLLLSAVAYLVLRALRQFGLAETELAHAQCDTLRLKVLKLGAVVRVSVRRVYVSLSESYPFREVWVRVYETLRALVVPTPVPTG